MSTVTLQINFRPHQQDAWDTDTRFVVRVWHRRAGKTWYTVLGQIIRCIEAPADDWRAHYIAPTFKQAKAIAWDLARSFMRGIPGVTFNESELRIDFPNGAKLQLLGAEQYDSLRGRYSDDIAVDETALVPEVAWTQVLSPMISDRRGRATFIGTPAGRQNLLFKLYEYARTSGDDEWSYDIRTWKDTNVLDPREVERMRKTMRPEEFAQELECSWDAALRGAYYMHDIAAMEEAGRVTSVKYDAKLPVVAALDLGWSDTMVTGFWQRVGTEHRCIMAKPYERTPIPDMVQHWHTLPFPIAHVILPHDAKVTELSTGSTRQETFEQLGCVTSIAPKLSVHEGIDQVRMMMPNMWMDAEECKMLLEALRSYRSEYDEVKNVHSTRPLHDWSSHWADMVRYYAVGAPQNMQLSGGFGPRPTPRMGVYA